MRRPRQLAGPRPDVVKPLDHLPAMCPGPHASIVSLSKCWGRVPSGNEIGCGRLSIGELGLCEEHRDEIVGKGLNDAEATQVRRGPPAA